MTSIFSSNAQVNYPVVVSNKIVHVLVLRIEGPLDDGKQSLNNNSNNVCTSTTATNFENVSASHTLVSNMMVVCYYFFQQYHDQTFSGVILLNYTSLRGNSGLEIKTR